VNDPIRILFDENFGEPLVTALAAILAWHETRVKVCHLFQVAKSGEKDDVFIPRIAAEGWILVSMDRGKRHGGGRLPKICRDFHVTHILLSASLHKQKQFEKIRAVVALWPRIIETAKCVKGTAFSLRYQGRAKYLALVECPYHDRLEGIESPHLLEFGGPATKTRKSGKRKPPSDDPNQSKMFPEEEK
jgi:hypothetical protein